MIASKASVLAAGKEASLDSQAALSKLCQICWRPVYAYIRKRTPSPEQAQVLTQGFFERFLEKNYVARAERNRGRFRSFLMTSVENFICDESDRAKCLKRGGGQTLLSLDATLAEEEEHPAALTPSLAFEKKRAHGMACVRVQMTELSLPVSQMESPYVNAHPLLSIALIGWMIAL